MPNRPPVVGYTAAVEGLRSLGKLLRGCSQVDRVTQSCEKIPMTKCLLERRKCRFSGAVAGCNVADFEFIVEGRNDLLNLWVARCHKVEATDDQVNAGVN